MKNVWFEFKRMKENFPIGVEVMLTLEPIEDYFEMIWAANSIGKVTGYNIEKSLVIVLFENGSVMHVGMKLLEKTANLMLDMEI
jgi:hypothetical protein